jgi:nucleotide-binding universal stress UspA family protein
VTFPFRSILLAVEGTAFDSGAERVGIDLAASYHLPLSAVLPLVNNAVFESLAPEREERAEADALAKISRLEEAAKARGVELRGTLRTGDEAFREVVAEARERGADLIVLPRRGRHSYLANLLLGELVHTVTGHTHSDVLAVPRASELWSRGILLATDGLPHSKRATEVATALAVSRGLPLTVLSVAEQHKGHEPDERTAKVRVELALAVVRVAGARATGRVAAQGKPHQAILAAARDTGADLIVIGRRALGPVERMLVGSTSEEVAGSANIPVLIVQHEAARAA